MIDSLLALLKAEKLVKADLPENPADHIKPHLEIDIWGAIQDTVDKHLDALKWILVGDLAGDSVASTVEDLRLKTKLPKGGIVESYLDASDVDREHWSDIYKVAAPEPNMKWRKSALQFIQDRAGRQVDQSILELRNRILSGLEVTQKEHAAGQVSEARRDAVSALEGEIRSIKERQALVKEVIREALSQKISLGQARQVLKDTTRDYATNWDRVIRTEYGMAASTATVQTIMETAGQFEVEPVCIILDKMDSRESEACDAWSHHGDGSWRYWKLSSLKPPGYNLGKKKSAWLSSFPLRHHQCRCKTIWIPEGFKVDENGSIVKLEEGEKIIAE